MNRFLFVPIFLVLCLIFVDSQQSCTAVDSNGDGWTTSEGDCDDADPTSNPAADELCDGADNDCDGLLDLADDSVDSEQCQELAEHALVTLFDLLHQEEYLEAVDWYAGSQEGLKSWNPIQDPEDYATEAEYHAALLHDGCKSNGLVCMPVYEILSAEIVTEGTYRFVFHLINDDGSIVQVCAEDDYSSTFGASIEADETGQFLSLNLPPYQC